MKLSCCQRYSPVLLALKLGKKTRATMCIPKLPVVLLVLSVVFNYLKATPMESGTSHHTDKRKCNTATCATQRLANFLVRSSNSLGVILPPTNVGSNTYGKRNAGEVLTREPLNYFPL